MANLVAKKWSNSYKNEKTAHEINGKIGWILKAVSCTTSTCEQADLRLQHDCCQPPPVLCGEARLLQLLKAVGQPFPLCQTAELAGLHGDVTTVGVFQVGLDLFHQGLGFPEMTEAYGGNPTL